MRSWAVGRHGAFQRCAVDPQHTHFARAFSPSPPPVSQHHQAKPKAAAPASSAAPKQPKPAAKKPKPSSSSPPSAASLKTAYSRIKIAGIPTAWYFDSCIDATRLSDGRDVVIGEEVWQLGSGPSVPATKLATWVPSAPYRWVAVPGLDIVAGVEGNCTEPRVTFFSLPSLARLGSVVLPIKPAPPVAPGTYVSSYGGPRDVRELLSAPHANAVLAITGQYLFLIRVVPGETASGSAAAAASASSSSSSITFTLALTADLNDATTPLGAQLAFPPPDPKKKAEQSWSSSSNKQALVQGAALWANPAAPSEMYALLGSKGRLLIVPLPSSSSSSSPPTASPVALRSAHSVELHTPMRLSDKDATLAGVAVWNRAGGAASAVTVGSDGDIAITPFHDGAAVVPSTYSVMRWKASENGSGCSKGYPYAPISGVCVNSAAGVAFTTSYQEVVGHFWDLEEPKVSPKSKLLCKTPQLAGGPKGKVSVFAACLCPSTGAVAYTNSNAADDETLKTAWPVGK
jgi:hypothetical protein